MQLNSEAMLKFSETIDIFSLSVKVSYSFCL